MQSSENKTKKTPKSLEQPLVSAANAGGEAPAKLKRSASPKKLTSTAKTSEAKYAPRARAAAASAGAVMSVAEPPTEAHQLNQIATLAYYYWESRGGHGGSPEEDWLRAEAELRAVSNVCH